MTVLVVGGGAREHAIAWKLKQDDPGLPLHAAPGNPGIAELATCHAVAGSDTTGLLALAERVGADLTVVGPEAPLAAGVVDVFQGAGLSIFGPTAAAARIESSKRFAKELMLDAGVPTAMATWHTDVDSARRAVRDLGAPVVIKASGLAAGKGVIVCEKNEEADSAIASMLQHRAFGASGSEILVEEFMSGEELSLFVLTDGENMLSMLPAQDHKRLLDGDAGPNTGGMGAYAPVAIAGQDLISDVEHRIIAPTLAAMREHSCTFSGLLYCGLMLTQSGPRVVEFNCRFGDPETEVVLPLLESRLVDYLSACARPGALGGAPALQFAAKAAVTTVVAAGGYPQNPRSGAPITFDVAPTGSILFHAGTSRRDGQMVVSGGRVVAATGVADSMEEARALSLQAAESVQFAGRQFRRDIGWRELGRSARAS